MQVKIFDSYRMFVDELENRINDWLDSNIQSKNQIISVNMSSNSGQLSRGKDDGVFLSIWYDPK